MNSPDYSHCNGETDPAKVADMAGSVPVVVKRALSNPVHNVVKALTSTAARGAVAESTAVALNDRGRCSRTLPLFHTHTHTATDTPALCAGGLRVGPQTRWSSPYFFFPAVCCSSQRRAITCSNVLELRSIARALGEDADAGAFAGARANSTKGLPRGALLPARARATATPPAPPASVIATLRAQRLRFAAFI